MKKIGSILMVLIMAFMFSSCAALIGAGVGAVAGSKLDRRNPVRGVIVGASFGFIAGAALAHTIEEAKKKAAATGKPAEYRSRNGRRIYQAEPIDYSPNRACNKIKGRTWENGKLIDEKEEVICK